MAKPAWTDLPTSAKVGGEMFLVVNSPADAFVARMEDDQNLYDRLILATRALRHDPGCIEAHLLLAEHAVYVHERFAHLNKAVETGRALWEPVADKDNDFAWWGVSATRPYMRAIAALGAAHVDWGDESMAAKLYDRLLTMNPNDNQGIRHRVAKIGVVAAAPGM
jgi:hypothetical protein